MSGIYIHIPFCRQKCYYCDFHFSVSLKRKEEMLQAILKEIELRKRELQGKVETIYFGGGTPSILSTDELMRVLKVIYDHYDVVDQPEITLEANPDDLDAKKIKELSMTKINRLSIGIQSFFDDDLKFMNRVHTAKESEEALSAAMRYFDNITIDLIYGIPNRSDEKWKQNLQKAFDFKIPHISCYALTVERGTALASMIKKGKYPPVDEKLAQRHFQILTEETARHHFIPYEISNFGKNGYFSKHNISYWQGKYYLGIGPSAHSFDGKTRSWNIANNARYIKSIQQNILPLEIEELSIEDRFNELIMTGLRTIWGVSIEKIESDFGTEYKKDLLENVNKHLQNKTLKIENGTLFLTKKGRFFADGIAADLFVI